MDTDTKSTIELFVSKTSPVIRNFIISGDLEDVIGEITKDYNFSDTELTDLYNLISFILIGLINPGDLLPEIMKITSLPKEISENLASEIQDIILLTFVPKNMAANNVGQSFEQIILNQAKAMQPAREPGVGSREPAVGNQTQNKESGTNTYSGQDPYREPV